MKLKNGYTVNKEFLKRKLKNKLSKKIFIHDYNREFTFTIDFGNDLTYMVCCEETGRSVEDDKWQHIKVIQSLGEFDIGWNTEYECPQDDLVWCDDQEKYIYEKN